MYACSDGKVGEWPTDGISFQDPSPLGVGAVVNHIVVELYGSYSCDNGNNMFGVYANDVPLNILWEGRSHACECGSCDPVTKFEGYFVNGFPNYNYGGKNVLTIDVMSSVLCLNKANITVAYSPPLYPGLKSEMVTWEFSSTSSSTKVCNTVGYVNSGSTSHGFQDPLPDNALLVLTEADVFADFHCSTTAALEVTGSLDSTAVDTVSVEAGSTSCASNTCDGKVHLGNTRVYQNGWPNYKYGSSNSFQVSGTSTIRIGKAALYLYYVEL